MAASAIPPIDFQKRLDTTCSNLPVLPPLHYYSVGVAFFRQHPIAHPQGPQVFVIRAKQATETQGKRWELPNAELQHQETLRQAVHRVLLVEVGIRVQDDTIVCEFEALHFDVSDYRCVQINFLVNAGFVELGFNSADHLLRWRWMREWETNRLFCGDMREHLGNAFRSFKEISDAETTSGQ